MERARRLILHGGPCGVWCGKLLAGELYYGAVEYDGGNTYAGLHKCGEQQHGLCGGCSGATQSASAAPCGAAATPLSATGLDTPARVFTGSTSLLTVKVTPASSPASTGIKITADLSAIAGSTTQPFYDDGTQAM